MGLTGIQIFKMLPKTNCKDCGMPTCLAFGMALAAGKAELDKCPHVSDEAREKLEADSAPPIRTVVFGPEDNEVKIGGETVLFRHEKTFFNQTGLGLLVCDDEDAKEVDAKLFRFSNLQYERVGLNLRAEVVALKSNTNDPAKFKALAEKVAKTDAAPVLMGDVDCLKAGIEVLEDSTPLLYAATKDNFDDMVALAKEAELPLVIKADTLEELADMTEKAKGEGLNDLVLDPGKRALKDAFLEQIHIRRAAIKSVFRPLGFPTITFPCEMSDDYMMEALYASVFVAKYAGVTILSDMRGENLFPLLLQRLNIYTDPQRPMKTDEGIYEINGPGENSPVLVTCNFSLTYFVVSGEIEASRIPCYLMVVDTDGLSVLTAWAAGKFTGDAVGAVVKKTKIADKLKSKNLVLPGYAAVISGDVEEEVGDDWNVVIGPREAAHIVSYLKQNYQDQ